MPITVTCACGKTLRAPDEAAGRRAKCPGCGAIVNVPSPERLGAEALARPSIAPPTERPTRPFIQEARRAFLYAIQIKAAVLLVILAIAYTAILSFVGGSILTLPLAILVIGYGAACYLNVVQASAGGDPNFPDPPDMSDLLDDVVKPFFLILAATLFAALPEIVYAICVAMKKVEPNRHLASALNVWTAFYFPMAVLSVAVWRSVAGVSPHIVIPAILRIPGQHTMCAAMVWLTWNGYALILEGARSLQLDGVFARFSVALLALALFIYFGWVTARMIGITHWIYRKELGWFRSM